jgi:hypothetical protein
MLSMSTQPGETREIPDDWSDLTEEEQEELRRDADAAVLELQRGESVPMDDVLPRYRQAG